MRAVGTAIIRVLAGIACASPLLGQSPCASAAVPSKSTAFNDIAVGVSHDELLGAISSPPKTELTLAYHRYLDEPSVRLGLGLGWQPDSPSTRLPIDAFADVAFVFRGPHGWRPFVGLEAGWTGFNRLEPPANVWPERIVSLNQRRVSHYYLGSVVAPLNFRHQELCVSSLALHIAEMGYSAHYLRFQLEILQIGATW